jgi:hypothetical protein
MMSPGAVTNPTFCHSGAPKASPEPITASRPEEVAAEPLRFTAMVVFMDSGLMLRMPRNDEKELKFIIAFTSTRGCRPSPCGLALPA